MGEPVALVAAFAAGLLSFFSPYVLPLIPGYLSYISGLSLDEMRGLGGRPAAAGVAVASPAEARRRVVVASVAFCAGFSAVFVGLGVFAGTIGRALAEQQTLIDRAAGLIIISFGLHTIGVLRVPWLHRARRVHTRSKPPGIAGAALVGLLFAVGWTPCLGPILAGLLALVVAQDTPGEGGRLLASYSLGLAAPFLAAAVALNRYFAALARVRGYYRTIEIVAGGLLIVIGLLILTNRLRPAAAAL